MPNGLKKVLPSSGFHCKKPGQKLTTRGRQSRGDRRLPLPLSLCRSPHEFLPFTPMVFGFLDGE